MKKSEISFLNVLFCLMVIFIHICSEPVTHLLNPTVSHAVIFTLWKLSGFVVQGFIMLSGVKMFLSEKKESYPRYIKARFSKIILPYIIAVFVYYIYFYLRNYYEFSLFGLGRYIVAGDLAAQFYFVVIISQFYLLKGVWERMVKAVPMLWTILISFAITVFGVLFLEKVFGAYNDRVLTSYLIYWVMGCFIGKNYERFIDVLSRSRLIVVCVFLPVAVMETAFAYSGTLPYYAAQILHIIYCICAILLSVVIANACSEFFMKLRLFKVINASSYYIYLWHVLVIFVANGFMDMMGISSIGIRFFIRGTLAYFVSIFVCGAYVEIKKRIRG